ncbi:DNA polymerase Y family protein [Azohydromonas sp.]|uniref:Y-family DNA polymerase n=1 Tax=Azohydromonas sp. TaxID=1872666 RepID=UPI002D18D4AB|nr:DNA polymerase Y family protein [Azohydromonas sp.]HMM85697.1 DNA polymerase Y family protein [Azohydromonas sp.]
MQWLALHLPQLSLEAFAASLPADAAAQPLALLGAQRIAAANEAARARGIEPGLRRATALALAPELRLGQACARRDAQALTAVAHAALAFTPSVALDAADALVLLEVGASLRLFGGLQRLVQRLRQALAPLGHRVQVAAAPTAAGAALLARWRDDPARGPHAHDMAALRALLDAAPLALLGAARAHAATLQGMGLATLADLRALPRAGLSRRFGEALLDEVDRARGERPDPREWVTLPPRFDARLELATRADGSEQLLHAADVLLARLVAWAQAQHARVAGFTLCMLHEPRHRDRDQPAHTALDVALATPSADADHLRTLLREHLARTTLPAPTLELRLHCQQLVPGTPPSGELFPTRAGEREGLVRLLERLRARLGDEGVQRLEAVADHRPEHATRALAAQADAAAPAAMPALHHPSWLCPEPLPLPERGGVPWLDGAPLQLLAGPERIEAGWWEQGTPVARDCFVAQTADGVLVWICRTRLPLAAGDGGGWRLHGRFG